MNLWSTLRGRIVTVGVAAMLVLGGLLVAVLDTLVREELERDATREAVAVLDAMAAALDPILSEGDDLAAQRLSTHAVGQGRIVGMSVFDSRRHLLAAEPAAARSDVRLGTWGQDADREVRIEVRGFPAHAFFRVVEHGGAVIGGAWLAFDRRPLELAFRRFRIFAALVVLALLGVAMVVGTLGADTIVRPLDELAETMGATARGESSVRHAVAGTRDMQRLARRANRVAEQLDSARASLNRLSGDLDHKVRERTRELENANRRLAELANTDPLTGLSNRRGLEIELERYLSLSRRNRQPLAVIMMDLDNFKRYNDACGHLSGDTVLRTVAAALLGRARASDVVSRWGGDEFCILVPATDPAGAVAAARRFVIAVLDAMGDLSRPDVSAVLGASAGVACYPEDGEEARELIARADAALYKVKASGGSGVLRLETAEIEAEVGR